MSSTSGNPVANSAVFAALDGRESARTSVTDTSSSSITLSSAAANTDYHYGTLTALTVSAVATSDLETTIEFTSGSTACALTLPNGVNAEFVETPLANRRYMLSIRNGVAIGVNFLTSGTITFSGQTVSVTSGASITPFQLAGTASNGGTVTYTASNIPSGITVSSGGYISGTYGESDDVTMQVIARAPMCTPVLVNVVFEVAAAPSSAAIVVSGSPASVANGSYNEFTERGNIHGEPVYTNGSCYFFLAYEDGMSTYVFADNLDNTEVEDEGGYCGWLYKSGSYTTSNWYAGIYGSQMYGCQTNDITVTDNR